MDTSHDIDRATADARTARAWRWLPWLAAGALWPLPWVAMLWTDQVQWTASDFAVFAVMLLAPCVVWEVSMRRHHANSYRLGMALALGTAFMLVWVNLAVGIIGSEDHLGNRLFAGVLLVAALVGGVGRLRAAAMSRAMVAAAVVQAAISALALALGWRHPLVLCAGFALAWLLAGALFARAARAERAASMT